MREPRAGALLGLATAMLILAALAAIGFIWLKKHPRPHPVQPASSIVAPAAKPLPVQPQPQAPAPPNPAPITQTPTPAESHAPSTPVALSDCVQKMQVLITDLENNPDLLKDQRPAIDTLLEPAARSLTLLSEALKRQPSPTLPAAPCEVPASAAVDLPSLRAGIHSLLLAGAPLESQQSRFSDAQHAWQNASKALQSITTALPDEFLTAVETASQDVTSILRAPALHGPSLPGEQVLKLDKNLLSAMSNLDQAKAIWMRAHPGSHASPQSFCDADSDLNACRTQAAEAIGSALKIAKEGPQQANLNTALAALNQLDAFPAASPSAKFQPYLPVACLSLALLVCVFLLAWLWLGPLKDARRSSQQGSDEISRLEADVRAALARISKLESQPEPVTNPPAEEKSMPSFEPISKSLKQKASAPPAEAPEAATTGSKSSFLRDRDDNAAASDPVLEQSPVPEHYAGFSPQTTPLPQRSSGPSPESLRKTAPLVRDVVADYNYAKSLRSEEGERFFSELYPECQNISCPNLEKSRSVSIALHFEPNSRGNFLLVKSGVMNYYVFPRLTDDLASARRSLEGVFSYPATFSGALQVKSAARVSQSLSGGFQLKNDGQGEIVEI